MKDRASSENSITIRSLNSSRIYYEGYGGEGERGNGATRERCSRSKREVTSQSTVIVGPPLLHTVLVDHPASLLFYDIAHVELNVGNLVNSYVEQTTVSFYCTL